ncbi:MAG: hypothetical protein J2P47_08965 [Acetobacteraceae bacterium]|nr:hypothetical protein [Acetobacteraceae bacterium]
MEVLVKLINRIVAKDGQGFDNPVLRDANALLDELTGPFDPTAISNRAADPSSS